MRKNYIMEIAGVVMAATFAPAAKYFLPEVSNFQALCGGSAFSLVFMFLLNLFTNRLHLAKTYHMADYLRMAGLGFLGMFLYLSLYFNGLSHLTAQEGAIVNNLWPMLLVLFACAIDKEPLTVRKILAMLLSFAGVVVIMYGSAPGAEGNRFLGILSCVLGASCYALFAVLNRKLNYDMFFESMLIWIVCIFCCLIAGRITEQWVVPDARQLFGIAWIGIISNCLPYLLFALALKDVKNAAKITNMGYLIPFFSVLFSGIFLHEKLTARTLVAFLMIIGGIVMQLKTDASETGGG
ncbi:MAG: DMT family transporter [Lachnospiraceae bacterium]|nr:DMT family transporter [Lachnospiraceae bacterium]